MTSIEKTPAPEPRNKPDTQVQATAAEKKNAPETKNTTEQAEKPKFTITVPQLNAEAQALVRAVDGTMSQLRQHPHYYKNEQLQTLGKELAALHYEVVAFLQSTSPIPAEFTERVHQQLAQAVATHGEIECARFLAELEQAETMQVRKNLEQSVQTHREQIEQPNLLTPKNATTVRAQTDMVSRDYRKYGNSTMLGKIVREVGDKDRWLFTSGYMPDEASREEALVRDASRAVDLRLTEMRALLRQQPDRVGLDVHTAREAYHGEVRRFAEALVGAGDVQHPALYQPELAAKYGQEAMAGYLESIAGVERALNWVRALDASISGHSKSDGQRAAIDGLMSGIRKGLQEKMDQVGRSVAGRPELEQQYQAIALDMARLFRIVHTAANSANLISADTIRFHDKLQNGGDIDFARSMVENSMNFDDLAYEHHLAHGGTDPLYEEIRVFLPTFETTMNNHPSLAVIRHNPEVEQMLTRLRAKPVSLRESSEHYSEFCSLRALMSSLEHLESAQQPDAVSLQREIQQKMQPVMGSFRKYLATQSGAIENGTLMIGGTALGAGKQESMKLLADMEGFGVMDISDTTAGYVRTGGRIATSIAVGVGVGMATGGLGIIASSIAVGASMTAYNIAAEGRSFDSWEEATEKVGKEFVLNAAGAGLGRVLAGARYAAQLKNVDTVGMGAKEIFVKSMQRGGMKLFSEHYDECVTLGAKLTAAGAEGVLDTLGSAALDTAFQGGEFWDNVRMNAMFCGISIGMEIGSDARRMVKWAADVRPETLKQLDGKMRTNNADIASLHLLCETQKLDPRAVYEADVPALATMLQSVDAQSAEHIQTLQARIHKQAAEIDQLLLDVTDPVQLKQYLKTHEAIDTPTRAQWSKDLLGAVEKRFTPAELGEIADAIELAHTKYPEVIDAQEHSKNVAKLKLITDVVKKIAEGDPVRFPENSKEFALRIARLPLDAGLAGGPPPPPPPPSRKNNATSNPANPQQSSQVSPGQSPQAVPAGRVHTSRSRLPHRSGLPVVNYEGKQIDLNTWSKIYNTSLPPMEKLQKMGFDNPYVALEFVHHYNQGFAPIRETGDITSVANLAILEAKPSGSTRQSLPPLPPPPSPPPGKSKPSPVPSSPDPNIPRNNPQTVRSPPQVPASAPAPGSSIPSKPTPTQAINKASPGSQSALRRQPADVTAAPSNIQKSAKRVPKLSEVWMGKDMPSLNLESTFVTEPITVEYYETKMKEVTESYTTLLGRKKERKVQKPVTEKKSIEIFNDTIGIVKVGNDTITISRGSDGKTFEMKKSEYNALMKKVEEGKDTWSEKEIFAGVPEAEQLYLTHCTYRTSAIARRTSGDMANRVLGYSVQSSSYPEGAPLQQIFRIVERDAYYYVPKDTPTIAKETGTAADFPTRFVYRPSLPGVGTVIGQYVYSPKDTAGRVGSYFGHVLVNKPGDKHLDILDGLRSFGSDRWQKTDTGNVPYDMPKAKPTEILNNGGRPQPPAVGDETLRSFLFKDGNPNNPNSVAPELVPQRWRDMPAAKRKEVFTKVLATFLEARAQGKSCQIVAEPEVAALVFYGIARFLPPEQRNTLSFSTYESDPTTGKFALQATTNFDTTKDVNKSCYDGSKNVVTCNTFTPELKTSNLDPSRVAAAEKIVDEILKNIL